jgi:hypothetical protein
VRRGPLASGGCYRPSQIASSRQVALKLKGRLEVRTIATVATVVIALFVGLSTVPASAAARPRIDKACRSVHANGHKLRVDLEHVSRRHRWHTSCFTARRVARKYLRGPHGTENAHVGGRKYTCYKSRADGVGWKYNCSAFRDSNPYKTVAIGIGRRF